MTTHEAGRESGGVAGGGTATGWLERLKGSAVLWSWMYNGFRFASGLILLPLLVQPRFLSPSDLGMYFLFLNLSAIVPMVDFGFALSVERNLSYAWGGAGALSAEGMTAFGTGGGTNRDLVSEIVHTTRRLYRWLSTGALVLLALGGSLLVGLRIGETSAPGWTWMAWGVQVLVASLELYTAYWVAVLRGLNKVTSSARWLSLAYGLKLFVSAALILAGAGLMAVPLAGLVSGSVLRWGAGREVGGILGIRPVLAPGSLRRVLGALWPNSWRLGVQFAALYLSSSTYALICVKHFSLAKYQPYGLSVQIMNIAVGVAAVWTSVKWPVIAQLRLKDDRGTMRRILWPRYWLQMGTHVGLTGSAVLLGPWLLDVIHSDKEMLPRALLAVLALNSLGELNFQFWTTLISTENRIPALWTLMGTQVVAVASAVILVFGFGLGLEAFVLPPLVLGSLFNYWWWAREGARVLGTNLRRFLFEPLFASHAKGSLRPL